MAAQAPVRGPGDAYRATQTEIARVGFDGDFAKITNLRLGEYPVDGERTIRWSSITVDLRELTNVHFLLHSWGHGWRGVAHTMLTFEFANSPNLVCSVEARLRRGQGYSVVSGFRRSYELAYTWSTEHDALLERHDPRKQIQIASLEASITQHRARQLFVAAAERTNQIADEPEWYHAMTNSCSANMVGWVDGVLPGQLKRNPRFLMPGYLPEYLVRKGLVLVDPAVEAGADLIASHDRLPRAVELADDPDFDDALRDRVVAERRGRAAPNLLPPGGSLASLDLADETMQRLRETTQTRSPGEAWGDVDSTNRMLLFAGPSGTGKTMAATAAAIANELGTRAMRADLRDLRSRYIGETEKNITAALAAADEAEAGVLWMPHLEAMFGPDEAAYVLQRIETHPGLVIVSAPSVELLDEALLRLFASVIEFA